MPYVKRYIILYVNDIYAIYMFYNSTTELDLAQIFHNVQDR